MELATCYGARGAAEVIRLYYLFFPPDGVDDVHNALPFCSAVSIRLAISELRSSSELVEAGEPGEDIPNTMFRLSAGARDRLTVRFSDPGYCRAWLERFDAERHEVFGAQSEILRGLRDEVLNEAEANNVDPYPEQSVAAEAAAGAAHRLEQEGVHLQGVASVGGAAGSSEGSSARRSGVGDTPGRNPLKVANVELASAAHPLVAWQGRAEGVCSNVLPVDFSRQHPAFRRRRRRRHAE